MKITRIFFIMCFPLLLHAGNGNENLQSIFDQLKQEKVLLAELEVDLDQLESNRKSNDYLPARFSFTPESGVTQSWQVDVRTRGRFRRKTCEMPPLRIKFSKDDLAAKGLLKHNVFKLVTHCMEGAAGDELILKEYLTYELYNLLTDKSFRTQLVKITYKDIETGEQQTQYGILIEDTDLMADRLNSTECDECYNMAPERFAPNDLQVHALFQYMIGNTDWSVKMGRNLKLVEDKETGKFMVVPYDFDFSGLVNAKYAIPNSDYSLKTTRQRYFLGNMEAQESLQQAIAFFISQKSTLLDYVNHFELLAKKERKDIARYIKSFYTEIENGAINNE